MKLKKGVSLQGVSPLLYDALEKADLLHLDVTGKEQTITSGREGESGDGVHSPKSKHYLGQAADLRVWDLLEWYRSRLASILGPNFAVVLERDPPHIHIQHPPAKT